MKLKSILREIEVDKEFEAAAQKLEDIIESDEWIVSEPILFRGKDNISGLLRKRETTWREGTRDTHPSVDTFVHGFYKSCFPEYPVRRKSRFATTDIEFAKRFGDDIIVIIPHKSTKISSFYEDPIDVFNYIEDLMYSLNVRYREYADHFETLSPELKEIVNITLKIYDLPYETGHEIIQKIPCPSEILKIINNDIDRHIKKDIPNKIHEPLKQIYHTLADYFKKVELGYPSKGAKDVMFQGRYIEVDMELFEVVYGL